LTIAKVTTNENTTSAVPINIQDRSPESTRGSLRLGD
jgi:hypothetical protein